MTDEAFIGNVITPEQLQKNVKLAEKYAQEYTVEEWKALRKLAKESLWFLTTTVLGYKKMSEELHAHLFAWMHATEAKFQFREILLPRGHYKSTGLTVADSIRAGLPDDSGNAPWPYCLGPEIRLCIVHETDKSAQRFLYQIASHFLGNPILMGLFPEVIPSYKVQRINKGELELPRKGHWAEPTFDTIGVGGKSQGRHYNFLKCDDLFGDKARDSEAERIGTIEWFDNIQSFLSTFAKDHIDVIGTRYSMDDLYGHIHKVYGDSIVKYIRSCEEPDEKGVLKPIFPAEFPQEKLAILKRSPKTWIQYSNNPISFLTEFKPDWKRFYTFVTYNKIAVTHGGLVGANGVPLSKVKIEQISFADLDIVIFVDPAPDKQCGYVITGTDHRMRVFVLKATNKAFSPPQLVEEIFQDVMRYKPRIVVIEEVNFSKIYKHWLQMEMPRRNIRFKIEAGKTKNKEKSFRVKGLSNYFAAGQIFFNEGQSELIQEYDLFGTISEYHQLDALAYGPEFWRPASIAARMEDFRKQEQQVLADRDLVTGYSD
jgi:predicted phage terminase large subunit-like protein